VATEIKACLTRIAEPGEQSVMELGHAIGGMILQLRLQDASLRFYQFPRMILVSQLLVVIKTQSWKQLVQLTRLFYQVPRRNRFILGVRSKQD
jgi:hypothetical protein